MVVPVFLCVLVRTTPSFPVTHEPVNELKCLNNLIIIVSWHIFGLNLLTTGQSCK